MKIRTFLTVSILLLGITFSSATEPVSTKKISRTQIAGTVVDSSTGEALAGVCLTMKDKGIKTYSDLDGKFEIQGVEPGVYEIEIDYVSYKTVTLKEVTANTPDVKVKVELEAVSK